MALFYPRPVTVTFDQQIKTLMDKIRYVGRIHNICRRLNASSLTQVTKDMRDEIVRIPWAEESAA